MAGVLVLMWMVAMVVAMVGADTNFLTGANDILAVRNEDGELHATPFHVQFGKKDIWLPRSGHTVAIKVNKKTTPLTMTLDDTGHAYFSLDKARQRKYRFWSALLGTGEPAPNQKTVLATPLQLETLDLGVGQNLLEYEVSTFGSVVTATASIFLVSNTTELVVSDIDGTITRSDLRGLILPTLGISDWKHDGIVELYRRISNAGYMLLYLTSRSIGQAESTRDYLNSLKEDDFTLPSGPVLLYPNSLVDAIKAEVVDGSPAVAKIATLSMVRGLYTANPLYAAYGNRDTDVTAYKALSIPSNRIFRLDEDSQLTTEGTGQVQTIQDHILEVPSIYP